MTGRVWQSGRWVMLGERVTVKHSASMTLRLIAVGECGDALEIDAYHRLVSRKPLCRIVDKAHGTVSLKTRGSYRTFVVPASAVEPVKVIKEIE